MPDGWLTEVVAIRAATVDIELGAGGAILAGLWRVVGPLARAVAVGWGGFSCGIAEVMVLMCHVVGSLRVDGDKDQTRIQSDFVCFSFRP